MRLMLEIENWGGGVNLLAGTPFSGACRPGVQLGVLVTMELGF